MKFLMIVSIMAFGTLNTNYVYAALDCLGEIQLVDSDIQSATFKVHIQDETLSKVEGQVETKTKNQVYIDSFKDASVKEFPVRPDVIAAAKATDDFSSVNRGESSLMLINSYRNEPSLTPILGISKSFDLSGVASVKVFDIDGAYTNKFGGTALVELKDRDGKILGRFFQSLIITVCK